MGAFIFLGQKFHAVLRIYYFVTQNMFAEKNRGMNRSKGHQWGYSGGDPDLMEDTGGKLTFPFIPLHE
jgi:hypothetical protein